MRIAILCFLLLICSCYSYPISLSDNVVRSQSSIGRNLLQAKNSCPLNFEYMNYTIITSSCKGPNYPANLCCPAFKDFACPYYEELNDISNECATIMFNYINLYGKYPPGIFSSLCHEGGMGLDCDANSWPIEHVAGYGSNNGPIICSTFLQIVIILGSFIMLFR